MTQWYYADAGGQRQGPFSAAELEGHVRHARLGPASLVWREGLQDWQPLSTVASELNLPLEAIAAPVADVVVPAADAPYTPPSAYLGDERSFSASGHVQLAGFWRRYAASFIDGVVGFVVMMVCVGIIIGVTGASSAFGAGSPRDTFGILAVVFGFYAVPIIFQAVYFTWMHASTHQATLGKMAVGIKVVRIDGGRMSVAQSLGRWAAYFFLNLFSCGLVTLVSAIMVGVTERKQGLHDMMCGTLVTDRWAYTDHPERQRDTLGPVTVAVIVVSVLLILGYLGLIVVGAAMGAR